MNHQPMLLSEPLGPLFARYAGCALEREHVDGTQPLVRAPHGAPLSLGRLLERIERLARPDPHPETCACSPCQGLT